MCALCVLAALLLALSAPAWAAAEEPVRIAFIDSGISTRHIDPAQVLEGKNYVFPDSDTQDRIGHGTATAGMVLGAAEQGVYGICPDALAVPLVVVDAYPSGVVENGGPAALCAAIYDAVDLYQCRVVNISLSTAEDSPELRAAVAWAEAQGVLITAAVGNDGAEGATAYPAAYDTVIAVGAADGAGPAAFSQPGVDLLCEGTQLAAATRRNSLAAATVSGTSYACARIAGVCARLVSTYPDLSAAQLRKGLYALARDVAEPGFDAESGWGLLPGDTAIPTPFLDVPAEAWYAPCAAFAAERGWMTGTAAGLFAPKTPMTRAMFATVLHRAAGAPEAEGAPGFTDVRPGAWYAAAVAWAAETGVVTGRSAERFDPDAALTREQAVTLLWRLAGCPEGEAAALEGFSDAEAVSAWAREAFAWAVGAGIVSGRGNGTLDPRAGTNRAEAAQLLMRFAEM